MNRLWSFVVGLLLLVAPTGAFALDHTSVPPKFAIPWGNSAGSAYIRSIPQTSQIGIQNCAASLTDGFPPLTFVAAGGCPPFGQDFNGILKQLSQWSRWQAAGGATPYDGSFSSSIGGYPKGTILPSASTVGNFWISTVDNNTSNPDLGGANWTGFTTLNLSSGVSPGTYTSPKITIDAQGRITSATASPAPTYVSLSSGSGTYTPAAGVTRIKVRMIGAGGGGGASGVGTPQPGGKGGDTSFGGWSAGGGFGGGAGASGVSGNGGNAGNSGTSGTGTTIFRLFGNAGGYGVMGSNNGAATVGIYGGAGAASPFGGVGSANFAGGTPNAPGAGGNGSGSNATNTGSGAGGGSGEYVEFQVTSPTAVSYSIGARGAAGTGTIPGGQGGPGIILIEESYN